jgi:hypothetical protein
MVMKVIRFFLLGKKERSRVKNYDLYYFAV